MARNQYERIQETRYNGKENQHFDHKIRDNRLQKRYLGISVSAMLWLL